RHSPSTRQSLTLAGLPDQVRAWISDGGGDAVEGAPDPDEVRTMNFQPQGGEDYWLNFQFAPDYPAGQHEDFQLALFCESRDEQERWTPTPSVTSTPTPTRTPTSSVTPTARATVYHRPTRTPTPARAAPSSRRSPRPRASSSSRPPPRRCGSSSSRPVLPERRSRQGAPH